MEEKNFDRKNLEIIKSQRFKINIAKPKKKMWLAVFLLSFGSIAAWIVFMYLAPVGAEIVLRITIVVLSVASIFVSIFVWRFMSEWLTRKLIYANITRLSLYRDLAENERKKVIGSLTRNILRLFGFSFDESYHYYLEEEAYDFNLNNLREVAKMRIIDLTSACLGIGFIIATLVIAIGEAIREDIFNYGGIIASSLTLIFAPIIAGFFIPTMWTLQDSRIKYITPEKNSKIMFDDVRKGLLSRFLGFSGIFAGIGIIYTILYKNATGAPEDSNLDKLLARPILLYLITIAIFIVVVLLLAGTVVMVTYVYLSFYHEKKVNELRTKLASILPIAQTGVYLVDNLDITTDPNENGKKEDKIPKI